VPRFTLAVGPGSRVERSPGHGVTGSPGNPLSAPRVATISFDDGGMNLLSSDALRELGELVRALTLAAHGVTGSRGQGANSPTPALPGDPVTWCPGDLARSANALLFRSARSRLFAAGADMAEMRAFDGWDAYEFAQLGQELFASIERLPIPTVCFIDGDCFGGALDLALAFDLRLATPRSRFAHPGANLGIVTGFGGTSRGRTVIDAPAARRLFLSNETFDAAGAHAVGLVDAVVERPDAHVERIARLDSAATRFVKELGTSSARLSRSQLLLLARRLGNIYFPPQRQG
jgi:enoyl-CoA hydratase/carnithine racemase